MSDRSCSVAACPLAASTFPKANMGTSGGFADYANTDGSGRGRPGTSGHLGRIVGIAPIENLTRDHRPFYVKVESMFPPHRLWAVGSINHRRRQHGHMEPIFPEILLRAVSMAEPDRRECRIKGTAQRESKLQPWWQSPCLTAS